MGVMNEIDEDCIRKIIVGECPNEECHRFYFSAVDDTLYDVVFDAKYDDRRVFCDDCTKMAGLALKLREGDETHVLLTIVSRMIDTAVASHVEKIFEDCNLKICRE